MASRAMFLATLLGLAILGVGAWHLLDHPVQRFVIRGELTQAEQRLLTNRLMEQNVGGVLSADLTMVANTIREVGWARNVHVRRHWPDHLEITLVKERPVARWSTDRYVGISGELLELPDDYPGLPQFVVALSNPQKAMQVYRLISQVTTRAGLKIRTLEENPQGEWLVRFNDDLTLALGAEHLSDRVLRFLTVYRRALADHQQAAVYADARYTNGVAVRFATDLEGDELQAIASVGSADTAQDLTRTRGTD